MFTTKSISAELPNESSTVLRTVILMAEPAGPEIEVALAESAGTAGEQPGPVLFQPSASDHPDTRDPPPASTTPAVGVPLQSTAIARPGLVEVTLTGVEDAPSYLSKKNPKKFSAAAGANTLWVVPILSR